MSMADYLDLIGDPTRDDVEGWLYPTDAELLAAINDAQGARGFTGDVLEIGAFKGKSAILLGYFPRAGESLIVCDVFDSGAAVSQDNLNENVAYFSQLRQADFEKNYLRFHDALPTMQVRPSTELGDHVADGSCRLIHVDACHRYAEARADMLLARRLLGPGGVMVVDDWSVAHLAGVAAALWELCLTGDLIPLAFTWGKFYATWDPAGLTTEEINTAVADRPKLNVDDTVPLGRHEASYVAMAASAWQAYSAKFQTAYANYYSAGGNGPAMPQSGR